MLKAIEILIMSMLSPSLSLSLSLSSFKVFYHYLLKKRKILLFFLSPAFVEILGDDISMHGMIFSYV